METPQAELLKDITLFLSSHKILYMITGSWSSIYYGRPRASHDIDFVVELPIKNVDQTTQLFSKLPDTFMTQLETIKEAIESKNQFQVIHLPTMLKMDFWILTDGEFDQNRFSRRRRVKLFNQFMKMATPEDTIIQKLIWYSKGQTEKHLVDAAFVLKIQGKNLDQNYLRTWIKKLKLEKLYKEMQKIDLEEYI
ncbi:nucleotidyl transferase AbiEii/AbiGii toxin family protein [Candidatus Daviesbacteria bacterium]|nr:nucleotidyl transferase AbiEii/AbiGii toxin family protein [Candidatus Daviesbacteria bacterium]